MYFVNEQNSYMDKMIKIEVAYALPNTQTLIAVTVPESTNIREAIILSGILKKYPEIDLVSCVIGIFGKRVLQPDQQILQEGDRIEIYRSLLADPKEVRRRRAEQLQKKA